MGCFVRHRLPNTVYELRAVLDETPDGTLLNWKVESTFN